MKFISHKQRRHTTLKKQAAVFQALSSTMRLAILELLYERDMPVNRIVEKLREMDIPHTLDRTNVCKNLSLLKRMGIVTCRKERQSRIYSLQAHCLINAMRCTLDLIALKKKRDGAECDEGGCT